MSAQISNQSDVDGRYTYRVSLGIDEAWVDDAIRKAGGYKVADQHSFPEGVENCDYRLESLFIELKILEKDVFEAPERQTKVIKFFDQEGLIPPDGHVTIDSSQLTPKQKRCYWDIVLNGVESIVKKANRQIRETAKTLGVDRFQGLILLVNKECESIEGATLQKYASHIIWKEKFSSLHQAVCFSAIPAVAPGYPPVIGFYPGGSANPETDALIERVATAFKTKIEGILGKKLNVASEAIGPVSNIREDRVFAHDGTTVTFASGSRQAIERIGKSAENRRSDKRT